MDKALILHVEDETNDALFVQLALKKSGANCRVHCVADGQQAVDYLTGTGPFCDRLNHPLPQLLLLDLKLPVLDGFHVLSWARARPEFRQLPIVILSGSDLEADRRKAHELGADSYLVKTPLYEHVAELVCRMFPPAYALAS
jgi:CheY-like chemotaxis protein